MMLITILRHEIIFKTDSDSLPSPLIHSEYIYCVFTVCPALVKDFKYEKHSQSQKIVPIVG